MFRRHLSVPALVLGIAIAALAAAGCGSPSKPAAGSGTAPVQTSPGGTPAGQVKIFFYEGEKPVEVTRAASVTGAERALRMMLEGPGVEEAERGLVTAVPSGTKLNSYSADGGTARADFSEEMSRFGGGAAWAEAITRQVEKTVTANDPSITAVIITVEGVPAETAIQP